MQLRYLKNVSPAGDSISKINAIAWSPNGNKLASVGEDRVVYLYNDAGERKDKFPTKASDKG